MSRSSDNQKKLGDYSDRALAMLVSQLHKPQSTDIAPTLTDEELSALYDGLLNEEDRAVLLRAIANDKALYSRWLALVEAKHIVDSNLDAVTETVTSDSDQSTQRAVSKHIGRWQPNRFINWAKTNAGPLGGVAIAASLLIFISSRGPDLNDKIDVLYANHGAQATQLLQSVTRLPTRSVSGVDTLNNPQTTMTSAQSAFARGIERGLRAVDTTPQALGLTIDSHKFTTEPALHKKDEEALEMLGRLAVLSFAQCQHTQRTPYFEQAEPVFRRIVDGLRLPEQSGFRILNHLLENHSEDGPPFTSDQICQWSQSLLAPFVLTSE